MEDSSGKVLARLDELRSMGRPIDGVDWFRRAQMAHARCAGVPVVYAARCGSFHSPIPYGSSFLTMLPLKDAWRVLRAVGTKYLLRCALQGRSSIIDANGKRLAQTGEEGEVVLVAEVQVGAPDLESLPPVPDGRALIPGIPWSQFLFDDSMIMQGRWYRRRRGG
jgi:predicted amidohydrolase